jgi:hypothetical protein
VAFELDNLQSWKPNTQALDPRPSLFYAYRLNQVLINQNTWSVIHFEHDLIELSFIEIASVTVAKPVKILHKVLPFSHWQAGQVQGSYWQQLIVSNTAHYVFWLDYLQTWTFLVLVNFQSEIYMVCHQVVCLLQWILWYIPSIQYYLSLYLVPGYVCAD